MKKLITAVWGVCPKKGTVTMTVGPPPVFLLVLGGGRSIDHLGYRFS